MSRELLLLLDAENKEGLFVDDKVADGMDIDSNDPC
jgi:hypothetical protein